METLTVPAPELVFDPPAGPPELEKPVTVQLPAVRYPDATEMSKDDIRVLGAFVYRGAGGSEEIWDEKNGIWATPPADEAGLEQMTPVPFTPAEGGPAPWKGIFVAAGQKDKDGNPRFAKAEAGAPVYRLRAFARAERNNVTHRGVSGPSPDLQFVSAAENQRFGLSFDTETARDAGRARFTLKSGALQPAAYIELRAAGGREVDIVNCTASGGTLARITLTADGDIRLSPAAGRQIVLEGDLEAQRISYLPQGGGGRQTL
ncbi:MAG TPA: hypothetical protein VFZ36_01850 [Vicinamibacterales bacterium]